MKTGIRHKDESLFQAKVIEYIKKRGGYPIKIFVSAYQEEGEPDLVVCWQGMFIAFELKTLTGRAREIQLYKLQQIKRSGGKVVIAKTMKEVEDTLDEIFRVRWGDKSQS